MFGLFEHYTDMACDSVEKAYEDRDLPLFLLLFQAYFFPAFLVFGLPQGHMPIVKVLSFFLVLVNIGPMFLWVIYFLKVQKETFVDSRQTQLQEYGN